MYELKPLSKEAIPAALEKAAKTLSAIYLRNVYPPTNLGWNRHYSNTGHTGEGLEISAKGWKRTVKLVEGALTIEQSSPLPPDGLTARKRGNVAFTIERGSPEKTTYRLN